MLKPKDRLLLKELQSGFPLSPRPYKEIAKHFGLSEEEIINKLKGLKRKGLIRYIGAIFNLNKFGIVSSLIAMSVPKKDLPWVVRIINAYPQVTHNYLRNDRYNLWFTLSASSENKLLKLINEIKRKTRLSDLLDLRTIKVFKIDTTIK
jgi:DNA-binding Lrp family transcriptional regulator